MSKRNRDKRTRAGKIEQIRQVLQRDFGCTPEQIQLIDQALQYRVSGHVAVFLQSVENSGKPLPQHPAPLTIELEDGTTRQLQMTAQLLTNLYEYLETYYGHDFGIRLYWFAFLSGDPAEYLKQLKDEKWVDDEEKRGYVPDEERGEESHG